MFGPVQIHRRGEGLEDLFSCRCSYVVYRKEEKNPVSAKKGSLKKFTPRRSGWSETFTELTGKNGSCQVCSCQRVQVLPTALWQGRCSSARLGSSGAHSSWAMQPSEALRLICTSIHSEPQSRLQCFQ